MGVLRMRVRIPEGLRVLRDGSWRVGDQPVRHAASLRFFKRKLVFEGGEAFVAARGRRVKVILEGPPFEAHRIEFSEQGEVVAHLDDGTQERLEGEGALWMDAETGRFECRARGGHSRALLSRGAHQAVLERAEQESGRFFLSAGGRRIPIAT
jgi:hypothetical protein